MGTEKQVPESSTTVAVVTDDVAQVPGVSGSARLERGEKVVQPAPIIEAPPAVAPTVPENRFLVIRFSNGEQWQYPVAALAVRNATNYGVEKDDLALIRDDFEKLEYPEVAQNMTLFRSAPEPDKEREWYAREYQFVAKSGNLVRTPDLIAPEIPSIG